MTNLFDVASHRAVSGIRIPRTIVNTCLAFSLLSLGGVANASLISSDALNFSVIYDGLGGNSLQITNVTINGNIGVGATGVVHDSGPSVINGGVSFSASDSGQFHNSNGSNQGPLSISYDQSNVSDDLAAINTLSTNLDNDTGTNLTIHGNQTINETDGTLNADGAYVFDVASYSENDGDVVTINGDGVHPIVFDFSAGLNLGGAVVLNNIDADDVIWNFQGTDNVQLHTNASSYSNLDFQGAILVPDNPFSMDNSNLNGYVYGGGSADMQIVSGDTITVPTTTSQPPSAPEPSSWALLGAAVLGLGVLRKSRTFGSTAK